MASPRILIADDESTVREVIAEQLRESGVEVECCHDAFCVLGCLFGSGQLFDLLLFDLVMPGMDGATLTKVVRAVEAKSSGNPRVPIIIFSGFNPDRVEATSIKQRTGCDEFIGKPVSVQELADVIRRYVTF